MVTLARRRSGLIVPSRRSLILGAGAAFLASAARARMGSPVGPVQARRCFVSNRLGTQPETLGTDVTTFLQMDGRLQLQSPPAAVNNAQVLCSGQQVAQNPLAESFGPADFVNQMAFEVGAVNTPITLAGGSTWTTPYGQFCQLTDKAAIQIPANTQYFLRLSMRVASTGTHMQRPYNTTISPTSYQYNVIFTNNAGNQVAGTGAMTGTTAAFGWGPIGIIGEPQGSVTAIGWLGTSIDGGVGDVTPNAQGSYGFWSKGLDGRNIGIPRCGLSRGSSQTTDFLSGASFGSAGRQSLYPWLDVICIGAWTNDFATNNSSLATVQANLATIIAGARAQGRKVYCSAMIPRTTSTDGWITPGNQTANANGFVGGTPGTSANRRNDYNTLLGTLLAARTIDGVIDVNAGGYTLAGGSFVSTGGGVEDQANLSKWRTDLGAITLDGTHPTAAGHAQMAIPVTALANALGW